MNQNKKIVTITLIMIIHFEAMLVKYRQEEKAKKKNSKLMSHELLN